MEAVEHRFSLYLNSRQNGQHAEPCHRLRGAQFLANTSRMVQRTTRLRVDKAPEVRPGNHSDLPNLARNDDDHLRTVRFLQIDRSGYAADHPRIELLRHKSMTVGRSYGFDEMIHTSLLLARVRTDWAAATPFVQWVRTHSG